MGMTLHPKSRASSCCLRRWPGPYSWLMIAWRSRSAAASSWVFGLIIGATILCQDLTPMRYP